MSTLLEIEEIHTFYGNIEALKGISLTVEEGEIVTMIGSNGAGKSTTLRSISGLTPPREGSIKFDGNEIGETPPQEIVSMGISQSPGGPQVLLAHDRAREPRARRLPAHATRRSRATCSRVFDLFPRLEEREKQKAGTMSGGEQQMLAIGRALMADPKLLLLDEPSMGIAPILVERIYETIAEINKQGTTILLVEQNANFALGVSNRGYVLETGKVALTDDASKLRDNPEVQKAYLGAMTVIALIGAKALWLLFVWLASAIIAQWLSDRKGYGEKPGLVTGLLLSALAAIIWLLHAPPSRTRAGSCRAPSAAVTGARSRRCGPTRTEERSK